MEEFQADILVFFITSWRYATVKMTTSGQICKMSYTAYCNMYCNMGQPYCNILQYAFCRIVSALLSTPCDLDLWPTRMNVLNGTSTRGEQLCQIILKYIQNCTSYGPYKFERMHTLTHTRKPNYHCDNYVLLTASMLDKNNRKMAIKQTSDNIKVLC